MRLVELVKYLTNPQQLAELYQKLRLNTESEALLIYVRGTLDPESEIAIFGIEETEDDIIFKKEGVQYIQLFSVDHAIRLIESDLQLKNKGYSDIQIAKRLLQYRQNDA